jgi:hypothetical protein
MAGYHKRARRDGLLPLSVIGALVGMLVGTLPATACALIFGVAFSPLYAFMPLIVYLGIRLFGGLDGRRGLITLCVFSAVGFYLTLVSCQAANYVIEYHVLFLSIPLVTMSLLGQPSVLPAHIFSSFYIFPFVFTLLGVFLSEELLMRQKEPPSDTKPATEDGSV